jgi:hypothetical protein
MTARSRLTKLEAAVNALPKPAPCHWCRGPKGGVGVMPLLIFADDPDDLSPYGPDGKCPYCGASAPEPAYVPPMDFAVLGVSPTPFHRKLQKAVQFRNMSCKPAG